MRQKFYDVLKTAFESFVGNIHTCIPGQIESYNSAQKKASVKPLIKKRIDNVDVSYPVISDVPVIFPGSSDTAIVFPLSKNDGCLILFSETSLENFLSSRGGEVDPGDARKFSLTDAVCIPGLFSFSSPGKTGGATGLEIIYKGSKVVINDTGITLTTGDAFAWKPNILPNDPFTGLPHGGPVAGITKLKGA